MQELKSKSKQTFRVRASQLIRTDTDKWVSDDQQKSIAEILWDTRTEEEQWRDHFAGICYMDYLDWAYDTIQEFKE